MCIEFWDSVAVEGTSYALLVYLIRDGVSPIPDRVFTYDFQHKYQF